MPGLGDSRLGICYHGALESMQVLGRVRAFGAVAAKALIYARKLVPMAFMLGCEKVRVDFPTKTVFESVSLGVDEGDRIGIDMVFIKEFGHVFTHRVSTESAIAFLNSFCVF